MIGGIEYGGMMLAYSTGHGNTIRHRKALVYRALRSSLDVAGWVVGGGGVN
jgi:hypothetical protein